MKKKRRIRVGEANYKIVKKDVVLKDPDAYGCIKFHNQTIEMRKDLGPRERVNTFFHELAHALMYECELDEAFSKKKEMEIRKLRDDEDFIEILSSHLKDVFKQLEEKKK